MGPPPPLPPSNDPSQSFELGGDAAIVVNGTQAREEGLYDEAVADAIAAEEDEDDAEEGMLSDF